MISRRWLPAALVALGLAEFACQPPPLRLPPPTPANIDGFLARDYRTRNVSMPYRLFIPPGYDSTMRYPLVVWLHGAGGAGIDNVREVSGDQVPGTHSWTAPAAQAKHPTFVLVPQSTGAWGVTGQTAQQSLALSAVLGIIRVVQQEYHIDSRRIYIAGQSLGGGGTWTLIRSTPNPFAAAIILCGVSPDTLHPAAVARMPIWVFQGAQDTPTIVQDARAMIARLKKAGGNPLYTEYDDLGHDIWNRVFQEPRLADWLFAQRK